MEFSSNEDVGRLVGYRETGVVPFDHPCELGYRCPVCRVPAFDGTDYDERLHWSEYNHFLWCEVCNYDYPSALCVPSDGEVDIQNQSSWGHYGRDAAVEVFLRAIGDSRLTPVVPDA